MSLTVHIDTYKLKLKKTHTFPWELRAEKHKMMRGGSGASGRGLSLYMDIHWNIFEKLIKRICVQSIRLQHLTSKGSFQDPVPISVFVILYSFFSQGESPKLHTFHASETYIHLCPYLAF